MRNGVAEYGLDKIVHHRHYMVCNYRQLERSKKMKTAEEILGNFGIGVNIEFGRYKFLYETLKNMVEHTQKEAYNQAVDQILKLMYDHEEEIYIGVFEDIEKLKK